MQLNHSRFGTLDLEGAIDRHPLRVSSDTSIASAIALMSQTRGQSCSLSTQNNVESERLANPGFRASCVLVMEGENVLGILTERDIVRLTAAGKNLARRAVSEVMAHPVVTMSQENFQDIFAALFLFRRYRIRHLPIADASGQLVGVVSPESIRQVLRPANLLKLRRVADVMTKQVIRAPLHAPILTLAQLMADHRVSCVVITEGDRDGRFQPVGIVTERDIVQFQSLQLDLAKPRAQDVMSTPLFLLSPEDSLWTAHQEMQQRRVRRLVVSWNWGLGLGIVTQTSLLRVFDPMEMYGAIEILQRTVEQLKTEGADSLSEEPKELPVLESLPKLDSTARGDRSLLPLVSSLRTVLERLIDNPQTSPDRRQLELRSALSHLEQIEQGLQEASRQLSK